MSDWHNGGPVDEADYPRQIPVEDTFASWAADWLDGHLPMIQDKAEQYGSNSLAELGRTFARAQGREVRDDAALEIGCMLYAKGKIERVLDAMLQERMPSPDTWTDLAVYALMARYIQTYGRWP